MAQDLRFKKFLSYSARQHIVYFRWLGLTRSKHDFKVYSGYYFHMRL